MPLDVGVNDRERVPETEVEGDLDAERVAQPLLVTLRVAELHDEDEGEAVELIDTQLETVGVADDTSDKDDRPVAEEVALVHGDELEDPDNDEVALTLREEVAEPLELPRVDAAALRVMLLLELTDRDGVPDNDALWQAVAVRDRPIDGEVVRDCRELCVTLALREKLGDTLGDGVTEEELEMVSDAHNVVDKELDTVGVNVVNKLAEVDAQGDDVSLG